MHLFKEVVFELEGKIENHVAVRVSPTVADLMTHEMQEFLDVLLEVTRKLVFSRILLKGDDFLLKQGLAVVLRSEEKRDHSDRKRVKRDPADHHKQREYDLNRSVRDNITIAHCCQHNKAVVNGRGVYLQIGRARQRLHLDPGVLPFTLLVQANEYKETGTHVHHQKGGQRHEYGPEKRSLGTELVTVELFELQDL